MGMPPRSPAESVRVIAIAGRSGSAATATLIVHAGAAVLIDVATAEVALRCLAAEGATLTRVLATSARSTPGDELRRVLASYPAAAVLAVGDAVPDIAATDRPAVSAGVFQVRLSSAVRPAVEVIAGATRIVQLEGGHSAADGLAPGVDLLLHLARGADPSSLADDLRSTRPAYVLPVAPEAEWPGYLRAARATGLGPDQVLWLADGAVLDYARSTALLTGNYPIESGSSAPSEPDRVAAELVRMGDAGVLNVVVAVDHTTGRLTAEPSIVAHGAHGYGALLPVVADAIADYVASWSQDGRHDLAVLEQGVQHLVSDLVDRGAASPLVVTSAIAVRRP